MKCRVCQDAGLLKISYHSEEPYDVAMCTCRAGLWYRAGGEALVRMCNPWTISHRIAWLEDFEDDATPQSIVLGDFKDAGKVRKGAKL